MCKNSGSEKKVIRMDVKTGNITGIDKNGIDELHYIQPVLRDQYDDFKKNCWKIIIVADTLFCRSGSEKVYELLHTLEARVWMRVGA